MVAGSSRHDAITLDDSDDEEGQPSSAPHLNSEATANGLGKSEAKPPDQSQQAQQQAPVGSIFKVGDRAAMERERLERQRKRRRDAGLPEEHDASAPFEGRRVEAQSSGEANGSKKQKITNGEASSSNHTSAGQPVMYWNGAVLKSYNRYSSGEAGTRFEEFLRPTTPFRANGLKHAIMATYVEDIQWLSAMFPKGVYAPPITMLTLSRDGLKPGVYSPLHPQLPNWARLVVPRPGYSEYTTMHMKFLMLFYEDRLRLMILSGNLVEFDWSRIENTAFVHDFPRKTKEDTSKSSPYEEQMRKVLASLSVPPGHSAMRELSIFDLSTQCEARLVASLPTLTPVVGWPKIEEVGIGRLAFVAKEILGKRTSVNIEAQGSSMGTYAQRWLQQFHIACQGGPYNQTLPLPSGVKAQRAWADATRCSEKDKWPPIKLLFPSEHWVKTKAVEGPEGAGTFFGKSKQAVERGFVDLLFQPESIRADVMMHHKAILAVQEDAGRSNDVDSVIGWAYMGSHNLTQAAWGNISTAKGSYNQVQLSSGNWELGVVVPVRRRDLDASQKQHGVDGSQNLAANIITWKRPVQRYEQGDIPWDMKIQASS